MGLKGGGWSRKSKQVIVGSYFIIGNIRDFQLPFLVYWRVMIRISCPNRVRDFMFVCGNSGEMTVINLCQLVSKSPQFGIHLVIW